MSIENRLKIFLPALAHVNPAQTVGIVCQLVTGELNGGVRAAGGGENSVKPLKGHVQIGAHPLRVAEGHTPPMAWPVKSATCSGVSILALV